jgi:hypothetical protein
MNPSELAFYIRVKAGVFREIEGHGFFSVNGIMNYEIGKMKIGLRRICFGS